jgi:hypothetical protein
MATFGSSPGLSTLVEWPVEHLTNGADHWESVAGQSYGVASKMWQESLSVDWQGLTADELRSATHADLRTTSAVIDQLQEAAKVARAGASDLSAARSRLRYAVADARAAAFDVGEDLSVADRYVGGSPAFQAARHAEAEAFAGKIWQRSTELVNLDQQVAAKVSNAMSGVSGTAFGPSSKESTKRKVQTVEHHWKLEPTPTPHAPGSGPDTPYPVNEVIATATDLDGNKVVLRRGYYDGKKGFGWDKIFWKHNITNPNVFTDLISHSRPKTKKPGELVYEIPIKRTHCTHGFFGDSCKDAGEGLTIRIVVDTSEGRTGVPDAGQKGVITMFPLKGGSGVVEVKPKWTMAPPWVSHNVPIN